MKRSKDSNNLITFNGLYLLASIVNVILFTYILLFLLKLEDIGCECAFDWKRNYIIFFCLLGISISITEISLLMFHSNPMSIILPFKQFFAPFHFGLILLFIITTFQYIAKLKREKCDCSNHLARTILFIVAAVDASVFAVVAIWILISLVAFVKL